MQKTIEELQTMVFKIAKGLKEWEQTGWNQVPASLYEGQLLFMKHSLISGEKPPNNLFDFVGILHKPIEAWRIKQLNEILPMDSSFLIKDIGTSVELDDFMEAFVSPEEYDQSAVKEILIYCRNQDLDSEYREVRMFLSDPANAVLTTFEMFTKLNKTQDGTLRQLVENAYQELPNPIDHYRKCPHCGWTLSLKEGNWVCNKENICNHFASYEKIEKFNFLKEEKIARLKPGIQRYTLLTGIIENEIFSKLKKYNPILYPEIDTYDIRLLLDGQEVNLDIKDYRNPISLAHFFNNKSIEEIEKYHRNSYIVIPAYRLKVNPSYKESFYPYLKHELQESINILTERELYKKLKEGRL